MKKEKNKKESKDIMSLALAFLVFCIWFAAKVYRIGIMTYGKKLSWGTIFRWLREK